jgi:hypothetical protein
VCAIVYGRRASLGSIVNHPNMGTTAISRHVVVLRGLFPNETYRYRLTATDARGRLFRTREPGTFRTTPGRATSLGADIAVRAKVVSVSSQVGGAFRVANAVDGNLATEWSSAGDGDRASITKVSFTDRRMRFEVVKSTGGNAGAAEIEVFSG